MVFRNSSGIIRYVFLLTYTFPSCHFNLIFDMTWNDIFLWSSFMKIIYLLKKGFMEVFCHISREGCNWWRRRVKSNIYAKLQVMSLGIDWIPACLGIMWWNHCNSCHGWWFCTQWKVLLECMWSVRMGRPHLWLKSKHEKSDISLRFDWEMLQLKVFLQKLLL